MSESEDERHLDLLSVFHYVVAALLAFFGLFPIIHLVMGIAMLNGEFPDSSGPTPEIPKFIGIMFVVIPLVFITGAWIMAVLVLLAGLRLGRRKSYTFCMVIGALECFFMPVGTILGVFTLTVLTRPSVKELFAKQW